MFSQLSLPAGPFAGPFANPANTCSDPPLYLLEGSTSHRQLKSKIKPEMDDKVHCQVQCQKWCHNKLKMCLLAASGRLPTGLTCSSYLTYVLVYSTLPCSLQTAWQVAVLCQHPAGKDCNLTHHSLSHPADSEPINLHLRS